MKLRSPEILLAGATLVATVPQSMVAIRDLYPDGIGVVEIVESVKLPIILGVCTFIATRKFVRTCSRNSHRLVDRNSIKDLDQSTARDKNKHYSTTLNRHFSLIGLSIYEFSRQLEVHPLTAWALLKNPTTIPRPEILNRIETALILPKGFFEKGKLKRTPANDPSSIYGEDCTLRRLQWYDQNGLVRVRDFAGSPVEDLSPQKRTEAIRLAELHRLRELSLEEGTK